MDNQGWIKIHRKLLDSHIWTKKPSTWYKVWQYILLKAYHSNTKDFKKGQAFFNFRSEQRAIGVDVTYSVIDHTMRFLKQAKQIATQKTTRGVIITVLNYNLYQNPDDEENDSESETPSEVKAKSLRNKSDTINKNDKNVENEKNINTIAEQSSTMIEKTLKEIDAGEHIRHEYQLIGLEIWEALKAPLNKKGEFIRIARDYPAPVLRQSYAFARDYPVPAIRWKMFFKQFWLLVNKKDETTQPIPKA